MNYKLVSIKSRGSYTCNEGFWNLALETARNNGWQEEGTEYDFMYQADEYCDEMYGRMHNLFLVLQLHMEQVHWDGNYLDRENQIVTDTDARYLRLALEGTSIDNHFIDFISGGGFRICEP